MIRNLLAGGLFALLALTTACSSSTPKPPAALQEDDPGWDCHTMGNRICGTPDPIPPKVPEGYICHWENNSSQPSGKEYICQDPDSKAILTY